MGKMLKRCSGCAGGPPPPLDCIPVSYEAEAGTADVSDEEAALSTVGASLTPAGPGIADADDVECLDDSTALIEGERSIVAW